MIPVVKSADSRYYAFYFKGGSDFPSFDSNKQLFAVGKELLVASKKSIDILSQAVDVLLMRKNVVLLGAPGAGKSTSTNLVLSLLFDRLPIGGKILYRIIENLYAIEKDSAGKPVVTIEATSPNVQGLIDHCHCSTYRRALTEKDKMTYMVWEMEEKENDIPYYMAIPTYLTLSPEDEVEEILKQWQKSLPPVRFILPLPDLGQVQFFYLCMKALQIPAKINHNNPCTRFFTNPVPGDTAQLMNSQSCQPERSRRP